MASTLSNNFNVTINRNASSPTNPNKVIESNNFNVTINRPITQSTEPNTVIQITKAGVALTPVNGTPTTGQYKVTITSTVNCEARLESDYKTITVTSATGNKGQIDIRVNIENKRVYTKSITVANMLETTVVNRKMSTLEQTAETLTAKFTDGFNMGIIEQSVNGIKVKHSTIDSNSYTHMSATGFYVKNKGTDAFRVDADGLYVKGNGDFTGKVTASSGTIGGYTISDYKLTSGRVGMCSNESKDYAFWAGGTDGSNSSFRVGHDGWLYASNASITGTISSSTISGSIFKSGTDYNPHKQNITGLQIQDDTIHSYGTKNNGVYGVTKISGGTINIGDGEDGAGLGWSAHVSSSDISLFRDGISGYFYVGTTDGPTSGSHRVTTTIDTNIINIGSKDVTKAFKVDYNGHCEFGNNYFTRGSLTINQLSQGAAKGTQTYLSGTTISATNIYQNGSSVSGSDIVLKDNIKEYEDSALDIINQTKVYSFNRILANPDKTEIGFLAQQVPEIFLFDKGEFTAEELDGLTAEDKKALLAKKTEDYKAVLENRMLDEISENIASFYDLDSEQTEKQIEQIMDEYHNMEYEVPISTINQNNIIAVMFKAIQELSAKIDKLGTH